MPQKRLKRVVAEDGRLANWKKFPLTLLLAFKFPFGLNILFSWANSKKFLIKIACQGVLASTVSKTADIVEGFKITFF